MGFTISPLPWNNGNLPLPFFGGNYLIVLLDNIYWLLYMYIDWLTWIIFLHDRICSTKKWGWQEFSKFFQHNCKLPLPRWKQGNHPVIPIYICNYVVTVTPKDIWQSSSIIISSSSDVARSTNNSKTWRYNPHTLPLMVLLSPLELANSFEGRLQRVKL